MLKILTDASRLNPKPAAVIVDLDHTLYDYDKPHERAMQEVRSKMQRTLNIDEKRFNELFDQSKADVKKKLGNTASSHSRLQYFQRMLELIGMKSDVVASLDFEQTYWRMFLSNAKLFPDAKETMLLLRSLGIPLVLLTDLNTRIQFRKIVYFELESVFDYVVTSEEVGADKPDARMFHTAMDKVGLAYDQLVWMIGDHEKKDGVGCKEHLNALFFYRQASSAASCSVADVQFDHYDKLAKLIEQQAAAWQAPK